MGKQMQTSILNESGKVVIKLSGRFDFNTHREFRAAYEPFIADTVVRSVAVDFSGVDYLDSSALGMLLMLRDKVGGAGKDVALTGVRGNVKQVLDIANFGKLFQIS
jgi:anti-anti-sigma factor